MNIYVRKIDRQAVNKQISILRETLDGFFEGKENVEITGEKSNYTDNVSLLLATDPRLGDGIKRIIKKEGDMSIGDFMLIKKNRGKFTLSIIKPSDDNYVLYNGLFLNDDRHLELTIDNGESKNVDPVWFKEISNEFPTLDSDADDFILDFNKKFSPGKLKDLSGEELLNTIFLCGNKTNMCYVLEYDTKCYDLFGSIWGGSAFKYGLFCNKDKVWTTGANTKPQSLSLEDAIALGTKIRDNLLRGYEAIASNANFNSIDDYLNLYIKLDEVTEGYINKLWFIKYYTIEFPNLFTPTYAEKYQKIILNKLNIEPSENTLTRMQQIIEYTKKCEISNVMFTKIFWTYCIDQDTDNYDKEDDEMNQKNCVNIHLNPRDKEINPLNIIVYGAPGTGKTYHTVDRALAIINNQSLEEFENANKDRATNLAKYKELVKGGRIVFTTFHQNYGYEDFIQGLRPDRNSESMRFDIVDGVFKKIADRAINDGDNNYVIIIDEINRANISKVFGELITLIEPDKRWGELNEMSTTLQSGDIFAVPNNLYIIGTMNSADKSISLIDVALRRRFVFEEQRPEYSLVKDEKLRTILDKINEHLSNELETSDLLIGHSYFMNKKEEDLCNILNNSIIPLLYEYFYDNKKKVKKLLENVIGETQTNNIKIKDDDVGRLKVEKAS